MKKFNIIKSIILGALFVGLLPQASFASSVSPVSAALEVSPYEVVITLNPGETKDVEFDLNNLQKSQVLVTANYEDFKTSSVTSGTPDYFIPSEDSPTVYADSWFSPFNDVLAPESNKKEFIKISVPQNANPGAHYAGVIFEQTSDASEVQSDNNGLTLHGKIAVPVLITVTGNINEDLSITAMKTNTPLYNLFSWIGGNTTCLQTQDCNATTSILFHNTGNVHEDPKGILEIYSLFGQKVLTVSDVNSSGKYILANSDRQMDFTFPVNKINGLLFGIYKVRFTGIYGSSQRIISSQSTFGVIDWTYILIIGIIAIIGYAYVLYKRKK